MDVKEGETFFPPRTLCTKYLLDQAEKLKVKAKELKIEMEMITEEVIDFDLEKKILFTREGKEYLSDVILVFTGTYMKDPFEKLKGSNKYYSSILGQEDKI
mmetsp:Transcript_27903/g.26939  ORF Transcript_27903/g.26939 Transcript_27903/m.26939 type:complete len:101 (+) Transcript_27903:326-628(+)|eukprot:CAMPEP_0170546854 /NCGR_PEP_ID=MMETSP0211-20121228/5201_1 /TAXON_ID=311385 /ORGANISM="Pseudokeronopsis sp., Strain OXSARD2" /LENGTH=100 /DNA_ID=CAMNT_0010851531 /DNA_START=178 /DNA_END=480 /DNA_ORIENTATION=-